MGDWVVVVDSDEVSKRQMDICRQLKPALSGAVECNLPENAEASVCHQVRYFPAFCNTTSNKCVYGLHKTPEEFAALTSPSPPSAPST